MTPKTLFSKLTALLCATVLILPLCTIAHATQISADGTVVYGGSNATITTSAGTWQFAAANVTAQWPIYFNGSLYSNGYGNALIYENGQIFTLNFANQLWYANGTGWTAESSVSQNGLQISQISSTCPQTTVGTITACTAYIVNALSSVTIAASPFSLSNSTGFLAPVGTCTAGLSLAAGEICSTTLQFAPSIAGTTSTTVSLNTTAGVGPSTSLSGTAIQGATSAASVSAPAVTMLALFALLSLLILERDRKRPVVMAPL